MINQIKMTNILLCIIGSSIYKSLHNEVYNKQKLEIIKWVLNRLKLVENRNTEAQESLSASFQPNDISKFELIVLDNITLVI